MNFISLQPLIAEGPGALYGGDMACAPQKSMPGFTLVEMMVALLIFSMLSVAGVILLRSAVDSDEITSENLADMAAMQRFVSLMEADLNQAVARPYRNQAGDRSPAFASDGSGSGDDLLHFTSGGQSNINNQARPNLRRITYRIEDGILQRLQHDKLDGGEPGEPANILSGVDNVQMQFRNRRGLWERDWRTERLTDLPRAVELEFDYQGRRYRHLFLVGTGHL